MEMEALESILGDEGLRSAACVHDFGNSTACEWHVLWSEPLCCAAPTANPPHLSRHSPLFLRTNMTMRGMV